MTGRRPAEPDTGAISVADFEEEEEMDAVGARRRREDGRVVAVAGQWGVDCGDGRELTS